LKQIDIWGIQLFKPPPQGFVVNRVKCIFEVEVTADEQLPSFCCILDGPVQTLHLSLRRMQPAEPLL
jgi:hypothetical protein